MSDSGRRVGWDSVKKMMGNRRILLGRTLSYQFTNSPRKALYSMSYYKFAAKMIGSGKRVLDLGCGEGLGAWLLAVECGRAKGIDSDKEAIKTAKINWRDSRISFECTNFLNIKNGRWDAVVNFDVLEHILPRNGPRFFQKITSCLSAYGIAIIGTPNITSQRYASAVTRAGHVNLYSAERLEKEMRRYFAHVFMFGANDEVVHTGFPAMAHYLIAIGCQKLNDGCA